MPLDGRQWVLKSRPQGEVLASDFELQAFAIPDLQDGEVLVRVEHHTVAPGVRPKLTSETYVPMLGLGEVIRGNGVGVIEASRHPEWAVGERVAGDLAWATHVATRPVGLAKLDPEIFGDDIPSSAAIGILGNAGLTAYFGLLRIGQAKAGDTVLVSSAAGAVGSAVGQIAAITGCDAVGIAGTPDKCEELTERLGYAEAINYRAEPDLARAIAERRPEGYQVYFDNIGGETADAALKSMRQFGRIVLCGQAGEYNSAAPHGLREMNRAIVRRLTLQGFIVYDFIEEFPTVRRQIAAWIREGRIQHRPSIVDGIEGAVDAFLGQFVGGGRSRPLIAVG